MFVIVLIIVLGIVAYMAYVGLFEGCFRKGVNKEKWLDLPVWFVIYFFGIWFIFATISESDYPTIAKPIAAAFIAFCVIVSFHEREGIAREDERRKIERGEE